MDPLVTQDWLAARLEEPRLRVVDCRFTLGDPQAGRASYAAGHIPGAVSIPVGELADRIDELPGDREIVVYCRGEYCVFAHDAVRTLAGHGRRAIRLSDGMLEWRVAGLPVGVGALA